jgi:lysophospholipase L1-like esterase
LKKHFIIFLFLFGLFLSGCDSQPGISPINQSSVILAFGDSLTHGTGAPDGQSYPDILSGLLGIQIINAGVPGETTKGGLKRLPGMLDEYNPTLVILCEGGNDFLGRQNQDRTAENVRKMIELVQSRSADLILLGVPKLGFGLAVPQFYPELAKEYGIPYQGDILVDLLDDNDMKSDAIHPNAAGYRLMAEAIHETMNNAQK